MVKTIMYTIDKLLSDNITGRTFKEVTLDLKGNGGGCFTVTFRGVVVVLVIEFSISSAFLCLPFLFKIHYSLVFYYSLICWL